MGVLRRALVLLAAFSLSLSFAVPVEDVQETAYDESESVPYEGTPLFSTAPRQAALVFQFSPIHPFDLGPALSHGVVRAGSEVAAHPASGSLIILVHFLRC
jgi:hypothetical protein